MEYRSGAEDIEVIEIIVRVQEAAAIGKSIGAAFQQPFFIGIDKHQLFLKRALVL